MYIMLCGVLKLTLIVLFCVVQVVLSFERMYGASIHWRPGNTPTEVLFSHRLAWEWKTPACKSGPPCPTVFINDSLNVAGASVAAMGHWKEYSWRCIGGCPSSRDISDLHMLTYTEILGTGGFHGDRWEMGEERFMHDFKADDTSNLKIGFVITNGTLMNGLEGHLNLAARNDTKRPNVSPFINFFPIYRVPFGCTRSIRLFPFDGDGDYVRCHWMVNPMSNSIHATLYEDECRVEIEATRRNNFSPGQLHTLSLYAQDYSRDPVKLADPLGSVTTGPFSRVPVVFTVRVASALADPTQCNTGPHFQEPGTFPAGLVHSYSYLPLNKAKLPFLVQGDNRTIITTGPQGMKYVSEAGNGTTGKKGEWNATSELKGIHLACGNAYSDQGIPGESRCAVLLLGESDGCDTRRNPNPCPLSPSYTCFNLWEYHRCEYQPVSNSNSSTSSALCKQVKVPKDKSNLGLAVGLPVALFVLLLAVVGVVIYLRPHWLERLPKRGVSPEPDKKAEEPPIDTAT